MKEPRGWGWTLFWILVLSVALVLVMSLTSFGVIPLRSPKDAANQPRKAITNVVVKVIQVISSPPPPLRTNITFRWDYPYPTNNIVFNLRMAHGLTNVSGWPVTATTNGLSMTLPIQHQYQMYLFRVTASNTFNHLESD